MTPPLFLERLLEPRMMAVVLMGAGQPSEILFKDSLGLLEPLQQSFREGGAALLLFEQCDQRLLTLDNPAACLNIPTRCGRKLKHALRGIYANHWAPRGVRPSALCPVGFVLQFTTCDCGKCHAGTWAATYCSR